MKHCPLCKTNFIDDDLRFCTDDGTMLAPGDVSLEDAQATQIFPEPPATAVFSQPRPTDYGLGTTPSLPQSPEPYRWANEAAPVWTAPPPPPIYPVARSQQTQTLAILSLVFGIVAMTFGWICGGFLFGLIAFILGAIALTQIKKNPTGYGGKPFAIGGMAMGGFVFVIQVLQLILGVLAVVFKAIFS